MFWLRTLTILILLASRPAYAAYLVGNDWNLESESQQIRRDDVYGRWNLELKLPTNSRQVQYQKTFSLDNFHQTEKYDGLQIPPFWGSLRIIINGRVILDEFQESLSPRRIFASRLISFNSEILQPENNIRIESKGFGTLSGFRGSDLKLVKYQEAFRELRVRNFLLSDVHSYAAAICIMVCLVSFSYARARAANRRAFVALGIYSLFIVPHHLLGTDFYSLFSMPYELAFKIQLSCQLIAWPAFMDFFATVTKSPLIELAWNHLSRNNRVSAGRLIKAGRFLAIFSLMLPLLPSPLFFSIIAPILAVLCLAGCGFVFFAKELKGYFWVLVGGIGLVICSFLSDVTGWNGYFLAHGTAIISMACLGFKADEYRSAVQRMIYLNGIVRRTMPLSVFQKIYQGISNHLSPETVSETVRGTGRLGIVLVDIIHWSDLNDYGKSGYSLEQNASSRSLAFNAFEKIMAEENFEIIKTTGDGIVFISGLFNEDPARESKIASATLQSCKKLLESLKTLNEVLALRGLPPLNIKISANLGLMAYGFDEYTHLTEFDVRGQAVDTAYRLESAMNSKFYETYGRDIALVHEDVLALCGDSELKKFFPRTALVDGKRGKVYSCFVSKRLDEEVRPDYEAVS